jgi:hypothetical protein
MRNELHEFAPRCPTLTVTVEESAADYTLAAAWGNEGWVAVLARKDGTRRLLERTTDVREVLRSVCQTVKKDFPAWLATEKSRLASGASMSLESAAYTSDTVGRYELREYRHGSIVGLAMIDTKLGRAWVLTDLLENGRKTGSRFQEVGVEALWRTDSEAWAKITEAPPDSKLIWLREQQTLAKVKELTRARVIEDAETRAARAVQSVYSR